MPAAVSSSIARDCSTSADSSHPKEPMRARRRLPPSGAEGGAARSCSTCAASESSDARSSEQPLSASVARDVAEAAEEDADSKSAVKRVTFTSSSATSKRVEETSSSMAEKRFATWLAKVPTDAPTASETTACNHEVCSSVKGEDRRGASAAAAAGGDDAGGAGAVAEGVPAPCSVAGPVRNGFAAVGGAKTAPAAARACDAKSAADWARPAHPGERGAEDA